MLKLDTQLLTNTSALVSSILKQVVDDLKEMLTVDWESLPERRKQEVLQNWWSARKYVMSEDFEEDCSILELDPQAARDRLRSMMIEGRSLYGIRVRSVNVVDLGQSGRVSWED